MFAADIEYYEEQVIVDCLDKFIRAKQFDTISQWLDSYIALSDTQERFTWILYHYTCKVRDFIPSRERLTELLPLEAQCTLGGTTCTNLRVILHKIKHDSPELL